MGTQIQTAIPAIGVGPYVEVLPVPIPFNRAPTTSDTDFPQGQLAFDNTQTPPVGYINLGNGTWQSIVPGTGSFTNIVASGTITAGTGITSTTGGVTATAGNLTATNGNLVLGTAGNKLSIATGTNASVGTSAAMTAGAITIATTAVTASSIIILSHKTAGGTLGTLSVGTITPGTSFGIVSSSGTDTSTVHWLIIN